MTELGETTFLILCGGQGTRMGGVDKPLLPWRGQPLVEHVRATVPAATPVLISANRNLEEYARVGDCFTDAQVIRDTAALPNGLASPLLGVLGGLRRARTPWLLVSPGDTPALRSDWHQPLLTQKTKNGAVAHDGQRQQHLHLLLNVSLADQLADYLASGAFEVWRWLAQIGLAVVEVTPAERFTNLNRPEELAALDRSAAP